MTLSVQISKQKVNPRTFNENAVIIANVVQFQRNPEERGSGPRGGNLAETLFPNWACPSRPSWSRYDPDQFSLKNSFIKCQGFFLIKLWQCSLRDGWRLQNKWILGNGTKGGGRVIFNPKNYIRHFGPFGTRLFEHEFLKNIIWFFENRGGIKGRLEFFRKFMRFGYHFPWKRSSHLMRWLQAC